MTKRVKTICRICGKAFMCNANEMCEGSVEYARVNHKIFMCYCEECTKKLHLYTVTEIQECKYNCAEKVQFD